MHRICMRSTNLVSRLHKLQAFVAVAAMLPVTPLLGTYRDSCSCECCKGRRERLAKQKACRNWHRTKAARHKACFGYARTGLLAKAGAVHSCWMLSMRCKQEPRIRTREPGLDRLWLQHSLAPWAVLLFACRVIQLRGMRQCQDLEGNMTI